MSTLVKLSSGAGIVCSAHAKQKSNISWVTLGTPNILEKDDAAK